MIRCFWCQELGHYTHECPNNRIMVIWDDGELKSASDDHLKGMFKLDDCSDVENDVQGESLVIRSLSIQVYEEDVEQHR